MNGTTTPWPTDRIKLELARLLVGIDTDFFDNGVLEPWRTIGQRVRAASIQDRRALLRSALIELNVTDYTELIRGIVATDPTNGEKPGEQSGDGPAVLPPAVPFPIAALPRCLADYVTEGSRAIGCPPDYIAIPLLASVSAAIGTTVRLQIKSEWYEGASLFTVVVAPSGAKKTPALIYALRFANEKSIEFDLDHQGDLETYDRAMAEYHSAVEARKRERGKSNQPELPDKPKRPTLKRTIVGDTTVEALAKRLKENPRGLLMVRDEMASLLLGLNQYRGGRGNDLQTYLSIWSGVPTPIDRKQDDDPVVLHQPFLSITGGIQPAVLPRILGKERLDDGCTARILFGDPEPLPHHPTEAAVREDTIDGTRKVFRTLYRICHEEPYTTPPKPHLVRLTREARARFMEWEEAIGRRLDELSVDDPFGAPLSKMPGYLGRLALVLHVVKWAEKGTGTFEGIDEQTISEAIMLADYFVAHAARVWHRLVESPEDTQMRQLQKWMERKGRPVTVRQILQSGVAGLKRSHEVLEVVQRMEECGMIHQQRLGKTELYSLKNPEIRGR